MSNIGYERRKAVAEAWKNEKSLVLDGRGTRDWSQKEQGEIIAKGKAKGYQGHHMKSVDGHNSKAGDSINIQFLTRSEHLAAHKGNYHNNTNGCYDPSTGKMHDFGRNKAHIESKNLSKPLSESQKNAALSKWSKTNAGKKAEAAKAKARSTESRSVNKSKSSTQNSEYAKTSTKSKTLSQQRLSKPSEASRTATNSKTLSAQRSSTPAHTSSGGKSVSAGQSASSGKGASGGQSGASGKGAGHGH